MNQQESQRRPNQPGKAGRFQGGYIADFIGEGHDDMRAAADGAEANQPEPDFRAGPGPDK